MSRYRFFPLGLFLVFSTVAAAKPTGTLQGRVLLEDRSPAAYASVAVLSAADSSLAGGAITGDDGGFTVDNTGYGSLLVRVSMIGMKTLLTGPYAVSESSSTILLPDMVLASASQDLDLVEVSAIQPLFVQKPDMLVMNVEGSAIRSNGSLYELLRKTPGVLIDQDGNISLRGKQGVRIMIDGKFSYLNGDQLKQLLQNIPAETVSRVEVITNPSVRYDAEGNAGIINIVTRRSRRGGFNGNATAGAGYGFYLKEKAGLSLNYGGEKWSGSLNWNWMDNDNGERPDLYRKIRYQGITTLFDQHTNIFSDENSNVVKAGLDFFPSKTVSAGLMLSGTMIDNMLTADNVTNITVEGIPGTDQLVQRNIISSRFINPGAGIYFSKQLDSTGRELSFNADYLQYGTGDHANYAIFFYDENGAASASPEWQRSESRSAIDVLVGKLDYVHPAKNGIKYEAGVKSSYVNTDNRLFFELISNGNWVNDTLRSNDFSYREMISAAYLNLSGSRKKLTWQWGLRAEQTHTEGYSPTLNKGNVKDYFRLFPSFSFVRPINENNQLNLTYSRRITRPDYQSLNPFIFYLDKYTFQKGNPFLQPAFSNTAELTHTYRSKLYTTLSYTHQRDAMEDVVLQIDSINTSYQTTVNLDATDNLALSMMLPYQPLKWWMTETSVQLFYMSAAARLDGGNLHSECYGANVSVNNTFDIPGGFKAELGGWFQSPLTYSVFHLPARWAVNAGVSKSFLKDKLTASLSIEDIFYSSQFLVTVDYQGQDAAVQVRQESRVGWLTLRYAFGRSFEKRKSGYDSAAGEIRRRAGGR